MNKIERMVLLPLTVVAAFAGVVEGIIICNKLAKVKVADAAIRELANEDFFESEDGENSGPSEDVKGVETDVPSENAKDNEAAESAT